MANALNPLMREILEDGAERLLLENRLRAIVIAYERAKMDPNTKMPSYLMAALEAARQ